MEYTFRPVGVDSSAACFGVLSAHECRLTQRDSSRVIGKIGPGFVLSLDFQVFSIFLYLADTGNRPCSRSRLARSYDSRRGEAVTETDSS